MNSIVEIWKPIMGYEGLYEVSNLGRVKSLERVVKCGKATRIDSEVIKTLTPNKNGYIKVNLFKEGKYKTCLVHRLVADTFLDNTHNLPQVDHINGDRTDNRVINLRYTDKQSNQLNNITRKRMSLSHIGKPSNWHKKEKTKVQFNHNGEIIKIWNSTKDCKSIIGISRQTINDCCKGRCNSAGGYQWQYLDDYLADWLEEFQDECMKEERVA